MRGFYFSLCLSQGAMLKEICGKYPPPTLPPHSPKTLLIHYKQTKNTHTGHEFFNQPLLVLARQIPLVLFCWSFHVCNVGTTTQTHLHCLVGVWGPTNGQSIEKPTGMNIPLSKESRISIKRLFALRRPLIALGRRLHSVVPLCFLCCGGHKVFKVV